MELQNKPTSQLGNTPTSLIDKWVNPYYLQPNVVESIRQSILAKPSAKYAVLDNFFREEMLDELIKHHKDLEFSEKNDRISPITNEKLPYDSAVVFARRNQHFGSDLFYDPEWHRYLCYLSLTQLDHPVSTEVKLRWHKPNADGFWIHTDAVIRSMVAICYFNKNWAAADGGLLQLWRVDEELSPKAVSVDRPEGRLDCLESHRINTRTPGGGSDSVPRDYVLTDQIVPAYNRLFLCNFQLEPAFHSVTPSNGRERIGFVQWLVPKRDWE